MQIQWYPGHMAKARRQLQEDLKLIDVVVEVLDARAPLATRNPDFDDLFHDKERVILLNKCDLADRDICRAWVKYFRDMGIACDAVVSTGNEGKKRALEMISAAAMPKVEKMKAKGINKVVRVMIAGIPNVGKSTFINRAAGKKQAQVGDKPGVTRAKQWIKLGPYLELMDTPGLLWPKLENDRLAAHLAFIGSIKDDIMDVEQLATELLAELNTLCPEKLRARYAKIAEDTPKEELLRAVSFSRGFLLSGGEPDTERGARIVLDEYRAGKIALVTLEKPGDNYEQDI